MGTLGQDIRFALRNLRKSPSFTIIAAVTLALGIGASTAIFSVIENVLMEPFPYTDAARLVSVQIHDNARNAVGGRGSSTGLESLDYVEQNHVFDRVIDNDGLDILYRSGEGTERFDGSLITPGTFEFLGMPPLLGRVAQPADYEPGAPPVFVMRYKTWVSRFSADPAIINKTFVLNGTQRTLIGVMPPRFGWGDADMWIPQKPSRAAAPTRNGFPQFWFLLGHLKPGVSIRQAESDLTVVAKNLAKIYPKDYPKNFSVHIETLTNLVVGQFRTTLYIVLAAVGLLLLIGCGNVANLLLARATTREKEFAIRAALGAGRWRIIRQLLVESFLLAASGAVLVAVMALGGLQGLVGPITPLIHPLEAGYRLNLSALAFPATSAGPTAVHFGVPRLLPPVLPVPDPDH